MPDIFSRFARGRRTYLMGILNVTPDSFSDGGRHDAFDAAVAHGRRMFGQGADIVDVGGESTRPGAAIVSPEEEIRRVVPVIRALREETGAMLSIDTTKAAVAEAALAAGAQVLNDIMGLQGTDGARLAELAAGHGAGIVIMHHPVGALHQPIELASGDLMAELCAFFERSIAIATAAGIPAHDIVLDPGIGFGKTVEQNWEILRRLRELEPLGFPLLLGASRKSFLGKRLGIANPADRDAATVATTVIAISQGIDFVRVHDVAANRDAARTADLVYRPAQP